MNERVHLLERCWSARLHVGSVVEVADELVGDHHILTGLRGEGMLG